MVTNKTTEKIKLKFIVSKSVNFYFFIDNFAEYRPLHLHQYNREIIKKFGKLIKDEKRTIKQYKNVMTNLNVKLFQNIRDCFFTTNNLLRILKYFSRMLPKSQFSILKDTFIVWRPRFEKIWKKQYPLLKQNQKILKQKYLLLKNNFISLINKLSIFYGKKDYPKTTIEIYLTLMPLDYYYQVGVALGNNRIILSLGLLKNKNIDSAWKLILHELTHLLFETKNYKNWINKNTLKKRPFSRLIPIENIKRIKQQTPLLFREVINSSSIWNLCKIENIFSHNKDFLEIIRHKLDKTNSHDQRKIIFDLNTVKQYIAWKIEPCFKKYIFKNKKIDRKYLDKIYSFLLNYPENLFRDLKQRRGQL